MPLKRSLLGTAILGALFASAAPVAAQASAAAGESICAMCDDYINDGELVHKFISGAGEPRLCTPGTGCHTNPAVGACSVSYHGECDSSRAEELTHLIGAGGKNFAAVMALNREGVMYNAERGLLQVLSPCSGYVVGQVAVSTAVAATLAALTNGSAAL